MSLNISINSKSSRSNQSGSIKSAKPNSIGFDDDDDGDDIEDKPKVIIVGEGPNSSLADIQKQARQATSNPRPSTIIDRGNTFGLTKTQTDHLLNTKLSDLTCIDKETEQIHDSGAVIENVSDNTLSQHRSFPDAPDFDDYDDANNVPIENFGLALLRGQGWIPGQGIGVTNKQETEEVKYQLGNNGTAGLGADTQSALRQQFVKKLEKSGATVSDLVKRINNKDSTSSSMSSTPASSHDTTTDGNQRERDRSYTSSHHSTRSSETVIALLSEEYLRSFPSSSSWARERLYVKIIDPKHKYYKYKGEIVHVSRSSGVITIQLELSSSSSSRSKDSPHETTVPSVSSLETVLPSSSTDLGKSLPLSSIPRHQPRVLVTSGPYRGALGYIITRNTSSYTVSIDIISSKSDTIHIPSIPYDDICEFI